MLVASTCPTFISLVDDTTLEDLLRWTSSLQLNEFLTVLFMRATTLFSSSAFFMAGCSEASKGDHSSALFAIADTGVEVAHTFVALALLHRRHL